MVGCGSCWAPRVGVSCWSLSGPCGTAQRDCVKFQLGRNKNGVVRVWDTAWWHPGGRLTVAEDVLSFFFFLFFSGAGAGTCTRNGTKLVLG